MLIIKKIKNLIFDTIFPITCLGECGKFDIWLCKKCLSKIKINPNCLHLEKKNLNGLYYACSYKNELVQKIIHTFKYKYIEDLQYPLSKIINASLPKNATFDLIAFVPLHRKKELIRNFNQTYLLAKSISIKLNIPITKGVLQRKKTTLPQAQLDEEARQQNIKNAFICKNKKAVINKKILLVDDVYTTGSTMNECAKILKNSGAKQVWGIVIAKG